eukprot:5186375-Amphidinium_carterae.1
MHVAGFCETHAGQEAWQEQPRDEDDEVLGKSNLEMKMMRCFLAVSYKTYGCNARRLLMQQRK